MHHKKSLGQNFLTDESVVNRVIEAGEISKNDNVLEIGPGRGFLTKELAQKVGRILAIEKDEVLAKFCQENIKQDNLEVLEGDVLEMNWKKILNQRGFLGASNYKVVANIPYYITGKILRLFLENDFQPKILVLMVQKEVAERVCQKAGKHSILSLSVQYFGKPEIVEIVPREKFDPAPEVDSAVLKITVENKYQLKKDLEKKLFRLIKIGFSSPRKTLANNLSNGLQLEKSAIEETLRGIGLKKTVRAQELRVENWRRLLKLL